MIYSGDKRAARLRGGTPPPPSFIQWSGEKWGRTKGKEDGGSVTKGRRRGERGGGGRE